MGDVQLLLKLFVALFVADLITGSVNVFSCFVKEGRCDHELADLKVKNHEGTLCSSFKNAGSIPLYSETFFTSV